MIIMLKNKVFDANITFLSFFSCEKNIKKYFEVT